MKKYMHVSIPRRNKWTGISAALMAASVIIRLCHYLTAEKISVPIWIHVVLPAAAGAVFLAGIAAGQKYTKPAALAGTFLGVCFFILKAVSFSPLHRFLCTILYLAVLIIFSATLLGYLPTKKLLYPLFGLPLLYHILVEDTQLYFFRDPPATFHEFMPELSVLCIMAGLLCLSIGLEAKALIERN